MIKLLLTGLVALTILSQSSFSIPAKEIIMHEQITEVSTFKFKDGLSPEEQLAAAQSVTSFIESNDGFISRTCSQTEDGVWVDVIVWENMEKAKQAAERAHQTPVCLAFFSQMDEQSIRFLLAKRMF